MERTDFRMTTPVPEARIERRLPRPKPAEEPRTWTPRTPTATPAAARRGDWVMMRLAALRERPIEPLVLAVAVLALVAALVFLYLGGMPATAARDNVLAEMTVVVEEVALPNAIPLPPVTVEAESVARERAGPSWRGPGPRPTLPAWLER